MFDAKNPLPATGLAGFADIDAAASGPAAVGAYVNFLDGFQRHFEPMIESGIEALALRPDDAVLDLGCGSGAVFERLARRIGSGGRIVGLDRSKRLLAEARTRAARLDLRVELHHGDASAVPLPDACIDAARADRLLVFLDRPADALAELVRVTRPGGRIVVTEADLGTHVVDAADAQTTAAVLRLAAAAMPNALIGRRLQALLLDAGLRDVRIALHGSVATDLAEWWSRMGLDAATQGAVVSGEASAAAVEAWRSDLQSRAAAGRFFASGVFFVASATVCATPAVSPSGLMGVGHAPADRDPATG